MRLDFLDDKSNKAAYTSLEQSLVARQVIAFVGAGCSAPLNYPNWKQLLCKLIDLWETRPLPPSLNFHEVRNAVREGKTDLLTLADSCKRALGEKYYFEFLENEFAPRSGPNHTEEHEILFNLPFHRFLTTNYDGCLDTAYTSVRAHLPNSFTYADSRLARFAQTTDETRNWILHLHGKYCPSDSIILTETDYQKHYHTRQEYRRALETTLLTNPILFVGFSLTDPDLVYLLRELAAIFNRRAQEHYILCPLPEDSGLADFERLHLESYNVRAIFYPLGPDHDHSARADIMKSLLYGEPN